MARQVLCYFVEPGYNHSTWFAKSFSGLKAGAARREASLELLSHPDDLRRYPKARCAVLVGAGNPWNRAMIDQLRERGVKPVLMGCSPTDFGTGVSGPTIDRQSLVEHTVTYFYRWGRRRLACVGNRTGDTNDDLRKLAFLNGCRKLGLSASEKDVYGGEGKLTSVIDSFLAHAHHYDGAVCVNDQAAVQLIASAAKWGIRIPEDLFVAGSGSCIIGAFTTPTLTTSTLDYYEMGIQAVNIWHYMEKTPEVDSLCATIPCRLICRGSTAFMPENTQDHHQPLPELSSLSTDEDFERLDRIENCLLQCDQTDLAILRGVLQRQSTDKIAAALFVAPGTIHYRLKKLYHNLHAANRQALLTLLTPYLTIPDEMSFENADSVFHSS